ncbi:MAG: MopE-related protein [Myxococcota bacterium]
MFSVLLATGALASETFGAHTYYFGDLHAHTGISLDAGSADLGNCSGSCGDIAEFFDTARANGLDFVATTDHVNGTAAADVADWEAFLADTIAANDPTGGFVTIPGGELWFTLRGAGDLGHKTLLLFGDDAVLATLTLDDVRPNRTATTVAACADIWTFMDGLVAGFGDALLLPHHPAVLMPMPTDWTCHDPAWEVAVEVYSEHGNSLADDTTYDVPGSSVVSASTVHAGVADYGLSFGFVGGTDEHDTRPGGTCELDTEHPTHPYGGGLTVVVLESSLPFDRGAIRDAIAARQTWVTTGPRVPATVAWTSAGLPLGGLGDALAVPVGEDLEVRVEVPSGHLSHVTGVDVVTEGARWSLVEDGTGGFDGVVPAAEVPSWAYVEVEVDGASFYGGAGVCDDGGDDWEYVWSSPSWIQLRTDWDLDGIESTAGDCDDLDASVYPGAVEVWYDGVDQDCDGANDFDADRDGAAVDRDCDDADPERSPDFEEAWYDGVDQDCDGNDRDRDADGYPHDLDCDDDDPNANPGEADPWYDGIDQDCRGNSDYDRDGDGHDHAELGGDDCDDADRDVHPLAWDAPYDGVDSDCAGGEYDADGDGFRAPMAGGGDCDDFDPAVFPGADEVWYDGIDQDCDGRSDFDQDGDGWSHADGDGHDCDDLRAGVNPGAVEVWYDGVDQDCDGNDGDRDRDGVIVSLDCDDGDPLVRRCGEEAPAPEARGCATSPGVPGAALAALALALATVRRRPAR